MTMTVEEVGKRLNLVVDGWIGDIRGCRMT